MDLESMEQLQRLLEKLPQLEQHALVWLMSNIDVAEALCDPNGGYTEDEFQQQKQRARNEQDYVLFALLLYQEYVQERETYKAKSQDAEAEHQEGNTAK